MCTCKVVVENLQYRDCWHSQVQLLWPGANPRNNRWNNHGKTFGATLLTEPSFLLAAAEPARLAEHSYAKVFGDRTPSRITSRHSSPSCDSSSANLKFHSKLSVPIPSQALRTVDSGKPVCAAAAWIDLQ